MSRTPARRMTAVQMPVMGFVADLIQENPGTISLGQGVVHYPPPERVLDAAREAIGDPKTHSYGYVIGRHALRAALKDKMLQENQLDPGFEVIVTAGSNMAFFETALAITDPGDEVILIAPYYFNHEMAVQIAGCTPVIVQSAPDYLPDIDALERSITPRTRAIVTVSPNNPTGVVYPTEILQKINTLCAAHGLYHISDEAYEYFVFDGSEHYPPGSASQAHAHTISLYSMSKAYGMAGWRLGYMAVPPELLTPIRKIQDTNPICPSLVSQAAAMVALDEGYDYCKQFLAPMAQIRLSVLQALNALAPRVQVSSSNGAFYIFIRVDTTLSSPELTAWLIREHKVAVIPGDTFGTSGATYLRIAYGALQSETVMEAIGRLCRGLGEITG